MQQKKMMKTPSKLASSQGREPRRASSGGACDDKHSEERASTFYSSRREKGPQKKRPLKESRISDKEMLDTFKTTHYDGRAYPRSREVSFFAAAKAKKDTRKSGPDNRKEAVSKRSKKH